MRDLQSVNAIFRPLWDDVDDGQSFFIQRPLLAHYTSLAVLEKIVETNLMWFGNPLSMNDSEEIRFGINEGTQALLGDPELQTQLGSGAPIFRNHLLQEHRRFFEEHAFDTYILCLSEHIEGDTDGILSMWRRSRQAVSHIVRSNDLLVQQVEALSN